LICDKIGGGSVICCRVDGGRRRNKREEIGYQIVTELLSTDLLMDFINELILSVFLPL
jgi:hypothetical protein